MAILQMLNALEWIPVVLTALGMGGGMGVYFERRVHAARAAMPIIRTRWSDGPMGFTCTIEMANRLDEDLTVDRATAAADFIDATPVYDAGGSIASFTYERFKSPRALSVHVLPKSSVKFAVSVSGADTRRRVSIFISSSARTLRSKRFTIRHKEKR